jgi:hypothetical protein
MSEVNDVTFTLVGVVPHKVIVKVKEQLKITADLDGELDKASEQCGFYASLAEKAETKHQRMELSYKIWRANEETKKFSEMDQAGEKKFTKDQMTSYIRGTLTYKNKQLDMIDMDEKRRVLKALAKAFYTKSELIRTKCSNKRKALHER